jgi:ADP-ribosylglycohydrolase
MSEMDKARSVIHGLAIGDALGWPVEFMPLNGIRGPQWGSPVVYWLMGGSAGIGRTISMS